jgi:hypothetical protein
VRERHGGRVRSPASGEVDLDSVRADLAGVVTSTLEPAHLSVWLGERD